MEDSDGFRHTPKGYPYRLIILGILSTLQKLVNFFFLRNLEIFKVITLSMVKRIVLLSLKSHEIETFLAVQRLNLCTSNAGAQI